MKQSDCQAGLTDIKDLASLCASGGWAFCSELRNVADELSRLWINAPSMSNIL